MAHTEIKTAEDFLAKFLSELFRAFNREGIDYAVARDYDSLPRGLTGRDLDILFRDSDFDRAYRLLLIVARSHAASVFKIDQEADTFAWAFVVHWEQPSWGIHVDFLRSRCNNWRGCYFLDETTALGRKVLINGIYTLRSEDILLMQFCRDIVGNLYLREKYREPVVNLYTSDPSSFQKELAKIFGRRHVAKISRLCIERNFADVAALGKKLRRAIIVKNLLLSPVRAIRDITLYTGWRFREYLRPNGIMVVILGGQSAGNQTLIEAIRREIHRLTRSKIRTYERTPGLLPPLRVPYRRRESAPVRVRNIFHATYEAIDCILGYWLSVRRYLGRKCVAAVFDGYFYDDSADSRGLSQPAGRLLGRLVPRPDVVVLLPREQNTEHIGWAPEIQNSWLKTMGVRAEEVDGKKADPGEEIVRIIFQSLWKRLGDVETIGDEPGPDTSGLYSGKILANAGRNSDHELRAAHHE